uniref:Uncharacterized protein n=1 Tax=Myotis myotis TaxID=51298 RepID=A0A7J7U5G0_MYOMY|nr:hypothetical protein mMyoMyo1_008901 [Myotis myotis]
MTSFCSKVPQGGVCGHGRHSRSPQRPRPPGQGKAGKGAGPSCGRGPPVLWGCGGENGHHPQRLGGVQGSGRSEAGGAGRRAGAPEEGTLCAAWGGPCVGHRGPARKEGAERLGGLGPPGTEGARLSPWTRLCEHMVDLVPGEVTIGISAPGSLNLRVDVARHQG